MPAIEVENLVFDYPGRRVLDRLSFTLPSGSVTALVGPNGAGKTTLMRCLAGLEQPVSGGIHVGGVNIIDDPRAAFAKIGYLHDSFGLYPDLTVEQCLRHAAAMRGARGAVEREWVARVAMRLGLTERLRQLSADLSRGWKQRVGIAQAIIHSPEALILDEPASGLDPDARMHLSTLIRDLQAGGMTIIVSSHILTELEAYSTHMLIIGDGQVLSCGSITPTEKAETVVHIAFAEIWNGWSELAGVRLVKQNGVTADVALPDEPQALADLLGRLVGAGAKVCQFSPVRESMENRYRRLVGGDGEGES